MSVAVKDATTAHLETMSARAASILLGVSIYSLQKHACMGRIRTVAAAGTSIRYVRVDVEALAAERRQLASA